MLNIYEHDTVIALRKAGHAVLVISCEELRGVPIHLVERAMRQAGWNVIQENEEGVVRADVDWRPR